MLTGNNTYKIDPLNRDNYAAWHQWLKWILDGMDLWDVTIGKEIELMPANADKVTTAKQWEVNG